MQQPQEPQGDELFDYGKARMDYFKKKAREILLDDQEFDNEPQEDFNTISLSNAYKNLKNAIKNPVVVYSYPENKPNYMKMTFSMSRIAN